MTASSETEKLSETIDETIMRFQDVFPGIEKKRTNTYTGSMYANLDDVWNAIRPHLMNLKLTLVQYPDISCNGTGDPVLRTILKNEYNDTLVSIIPLMLEKHTPQGMGSALTYMRRYAICTMLGIVETEDDDANSLERITEQPITDRQMGQIYDLIAATDTNSEKVAEHIESTWNRASIEELNYSQASTLIAMLKSKQSRLERERSSAA